MRMIKRDFVTDPAGKHPTNHNYAPLSPKLIVRLAAPHTWPAAILPVLLAVTLTIAFGYPLSIVLALVLLLICILMQSAVNTFNDYFDFVKGTDNIENQDDPTDAVLVYNNVNPKKVLAVAVLMLVAALLFGVYIIMVAGWVPLLFGIAGATIIVFYSGGKTPISYLPIGEYVSGITMGGIMTFACYYALTLDLDWRVILLCIPVMLGIGLIMFTNNTCDIEKDIEAGRKTQAVLLGRKGARNAYHGALIAWLLAIMVLVAVFFTPGLIIMPFMLLILYPSLSMLWKNPLTSQSRGPAMGACLNANITLGVFYCAAILTGPLATIIL